MKWLGYGTCKSLEAFAATEFNELSSGRQSRQDVKYFRRCKDCLLPHLQGVAGGLVALQQGRTPSYRFCLYQATSNTLKMGTQSAPDTSKTLQILMRLSGQEHFTGYGAYEPDDSTKTF
jgi:hypothetical protein